MLPRAVRDALGIRPGEMLRYPVTDAGVLIGKAPTHAHDPFAVFTEWAGTADEKAYRVL